ncbi:MAG TPA: tRNA (N6-isopentenyl adenosine(37)-C2)-methylthiotransferase MiaB [Nitrospinota bacterium]|nr:tRNA (N6-isopentenyl adenosine(37)-C2)-methylthiotransferase MiaB [Nitrospinota bacterium]
MVEKKLSLLTYGCQMNKHDSERIAGILKEENYSLTDNIEKADMILLNTCSVREKAEQKVYSQLGRLKKLKEKSPHLIIGVCGCIAQKEKKRILNKVPFVDLIFGTHNIHNLPQLLHNFRYGNEKVVEILDESVDFNFSSPIYRESKIQAWVSIMHGCNNYCSYCVVPYTRGREKSMPSSLILDECARLSNEGYKEVTLLGQNVNSYGNDIKGEGDFADLLEKVNQIDSLERIRFITSHPKDISEKLIERISTLPKVCEHLHLPIQSGSDRILEKMNRGYTAEHYLEIITKLRSLIPDIGLTTDIIIGFPEEKEEDFQLTKRLLQDIKYDIIFLFKYSPRPETKAALLKETVSAEKKQERFDDLLSIQKEITLSKNKSLEGKIEEILVEGESKKNKNKLTGRTRTNKIVNFYGSKDLIGKTINIYIKKGGLYSLEGELIRGN